MKPPVDLISITNFLKDTLRRVNNKDATYNKAILMYCTVTCIIRQSYHNQLTLIMAIPKSDQFVMRTRSFSKASGSSVSSLFTSKYRFTVQPKMNLYCWMVVSEQAWPHQYNNDNVSKNTLPGHFRKDSTIAPIFGFPCLSWLLGSSHVATIRFACFDAAPVPHAAVDIATTYARVNRCIVLAISMRPWGLRAMRDSYHRDSSPRTPQCGR